MFSDALVDLNDACIAEFGGASNGYPATYSRPASANFTAVSSFSIDVTVDTAGDYASPTGPIYGGVFVSLADIPLGPQKGDLITFTSLSARSYKVEEIFRDDAAGNATLKVRWTGL